ncbi:hypothetical protein [Lutibacter sp.]|uniref:hypothetical protein n=1 Tax=Lutibacter sp. TaxID=1925666 RepID=UPI003567CF4D
MKNIKVKYNLLALFIFFTTILFGQDVIEAAKSTKNKSYASLDLNFISNAVFMGRKDSIAAPYLNPSITYHHKSGFYGTGSFSYLTQKDQNRIDLYLLTVGIDYSNTKFYVDVSASKYFFNDESYNVISQVESDISANLKYNLNLFNISLMASNYFSSNNTSDFFLSTAISHDFVSTNNKFQFSPTIGVHFGSQNFYEAYYVKKQTQNSGTGTGTQTGDGTGTGTGEGDGDGTGTGTGTGTQTGEGDGNGTGTGTGTGEGDGNGTGTSTGSSKASYTAKDLMSVDDETTTITELVINESEKFKTMAIDLKLPFWYITKSFTYSFIPVISFPQSETLVINGDTIEKENLKSTFYFIAGISYKFN